MKTCKKCNINKSKSCFYKKTYASGAIGLRSYCIDCSHTERNKWRAANKAHDDARNGEYNKKNAARIRGMKLVKNYWPNLTWQEALSEWNKLYLSQNKTCALCCQHSNRLHVDHCHNTGLVRGLLCYNCNSGIGRLKDSVIILQKAIYYINITKRRLSEIY